MSKNEYLNDGSIEERSLCLALIRQVMSGNEPDVEYLKNYDNSAFPSKVHNGFFYKDYSQDRWKYSTRIAENIPNWPCLKLEPEILKEASKIEYETQGVQKYLNKEIVIDKTQITYDSQNYSIDTTYHVRYRNKSKNQIL